MSNYTKVKQASDIDLSGISTDIKIINGDVKSLTLTDFKGRELFISVGSYSVEVCVPTPPKTVTGYSVTGQVQVGDIWCPVFNTFSSRYNAEKWAERVNGEIEEIQLLATDVPTDPVPF